MIVDDAEGEPSSLGDPASSFTLALYGAFAVFASVLRGLLALDAKLLLLCVFWTSFRWHVSFSFHWAVDLGKLSRCRFISVLQQENCSHSVRTVLCDESVTSRFRKTDKFGAQARVQKMLRSTFDQASYAMWLEFVRRFERRIQKLSPFRRTRKR